MLRPVDHYFSTKTEPAKSCLEFLRAYVLSYDGITEGWSYGMPFYYFRKHRICYLWTDKLTGKPYLGIVDGKLIDHQALVSQGRKRMKILPLEPEEDMPVELLDEIMKKLLGLYQ